MPAALAAAGLPAAGLATRTVPAFAWATPLPAVTTAALAVFRAQSRLSMALGAPATGAIAPTIAAQEHRTEPYLATALLAAALVRGQPQLLLKTALTLPNVFAPAQLPAGHGRHVLRPHATMMQIATKAMSAPPIFAITLALAALLVAEPIIPIPAMTATPAP